jgi:hypothetical protein
MRRKKAPQVISGGDAAHWLRYGIVLALAFLCSASMAAAATLSGTVKNGTTNRPVSGTEVVLMRLQHGMDPIAKTKTDSRGRFHFINSDIAKSQMLLQVAYNGILYYNAVSPDHPVAEIVVYNTTSDPKAILVASHAIIFHPNGPTLQVEEQYLVQNPSKPPVAFRPADKRTFEFQLPDAAKQVQVSAWTEPGMPTLQKTSELPNHRQSIDWAFRPGKSRIRISYNLPYASSQATIHTASLYSLTHIFLAAPPGVNVVSEGFSRLGSEQGYDVYARQSVAANTALDISVSGKASPAAAPGIGNPSANSSQAAVSTLPGRLHNLTWLLAAGLAVLLFAGTMLLWRRSSAAPATASASGSAAGSGHAAIGAEAKRSRPSAKAVAREVQRELDEIKEQLLQLELRHQGGTLGDDEYARERKRVEDLLRGLLRG